MVNSLASTVVNHLRRAALAPHGAGLTDGQLLQRFIDSRDEPAFEMLVRRHASMVYGVCRRVIRHTHDAEDAFQATFLVLARKAASVVPVEAVGNWLYGVAYHTSLKAQAVAIKRRAIERQVNIMPEAPAPDDGLWHEVLPLLDRELSRLPDKYRLPTVLCELEGRSRREVAQQLRIPEGTLSSRLTTARRLLARRLRQHGVTLAGGVLAASLAETATATAAPVPASLIGATVKAATIFVTGQAVQASPPAALAEGVLKAMFLTKLKSSTVMVLACCGLALLFGGAAYRTLPTVAAQSTDAVASDESPVEVGDPAEQGDGDRTIRGSGNLVSKDIAIKDFTAVEVGTVFRVEITRADTFRVTVTADDNLLPLIKVTKDGSSLRLALDAQNKAVTSTTLKATITMPALERIWAASASQVQCTGFKSDKAFKADIAHASKLNGDIEAAKVTLEVVGGSSVTLKGSAKEAHLSASNASQLHLGDLVLDRADVTLKNASSATINVKSQLDYDIANASRLVYAGDPALGKQQATGASSASRKGARRGKAAPTGKDAANQLLTFPHGPTAFNEHLRAMNGHLRAIHAEHFNGVRRFGPMQEESARVEDAPQAKAIAIGDSVPDFSVSDLDGKAVKLSQLQKDSRRTSSGIVVLSFWCSFCPSCRRVEKRLDKLATDYEGKAFVVALDASAGETAEMVRAAVRKEALTLPVLLDPDGRTADLFATAATTTTVVIDGQGVLRYCGRFNDGDRAYAEDALKALLAGGEVAVKITRHDGCRIIRK
jgi:RNA polymerase sigma factor (sigma-70 family)